MTNTKNTINGLKNIFSLAAREQCMNNLRKITVPRYGKKPTKSAAVLVPLCKLDEVPSLLYTVRASHLRTYRGEVAFPGGKTDKDEDAVQTALRETFEEIGLAHNKIEVWGKGPTFPGRNNEILITPVIGSIPNLKPEDININLKEVTEVFSIPIESLCDPKNQYYTQFSNGYIMPVFVVDNYKIWGFTAYLTHAFLSSLLTQDIYKNDWMKKKIKLDKIEKT